MPLHLNRPDYGTIATNVRKTTKAAALHPYLRLFVFLSTFIALFSAVVIKDDVLPRLSSPKDGPSGDRAWEDLQYITRHPHPWNSKQNDVVRDYILKEMYKGNSGMRKRLTLVSKKYPDIDVDDDRFSMVLDDRKDLITRLAGNNNVTVTYFEGLNVLVRIPGTSGATGTILLSAHIDSVSTAPGATVPLIHDGVDFRTMEWEQFRQWSWFVTLLNIVQREISSSISTTAKKTSSGEPKRITLTDSPC
jgi:hypothetical protein